MMMGMILIRKGMMMIIQEDELMDDFVYWDSIGGHVEDQARPANRQNGVRSPFELRLSTVFENLQGVLSKCTNRKKS